MPWVVGSSESVTVAVIRAVAEETGRDPTELRPIANVLDPDALEAIYANASADNPIELTFRYEGCTVSVDQDSIDVEQGTRRL